MAAQPQITLITLSYNSGDEIVRCLDALTRLDATIIHADNGSVDIDMDDLRQRFPTVHHIQHGHNLGFAAGMNRAAAVATTEWIGFINPDAFADAGWVDAMRVAIASHPEVSIFTSLQVAAENPEIMDGAGDSVTFFGFPYRSGFGHRVPGKLEIREVFAPCGAAFLIRRLLFEQLGGFDERFFCYCEDADLGFRAQLIGETTLFVPQARVSHVGSASTSVRSDFALYHGYRNRLRLFLKNMPLALLLPLLPLHAAVTLAGACADTLRGRGKVAWPAIKAGLSNLRPLLSQRKLIQRGRTIGTLRLAKSLTWNPWKIARRDLDHRRPT